MQMQLSFPLADETPDDGAGSSFSHSVLPTPAPSADPLTLTDDDLDGDTLRDECGVFGVFGHPDAAALTALGLHALQHRGQEAAGLVSFDGEHFHSDRRMGLVGDHFSSVKVMERLKGDMSHG